MSLRVLVQPRPNFEQLKGGDNIQLTKSIAHLRAQGIEAEISTDPEIELAPFDVVEIFNLGEGLTPLQYLFNARRQNKPVVIMPIYWNLARFRDGTAEFFHKPPPDSATSAALLEELAQLRERRERFGRTLALQQATLILPNSQMEGELLARDLDAPPEKMRVVYNGAAPMFQTPRAEAFVEKYGVRDFVLCVGRIAPQKNQLGLVKAWHDEQTPLVLIGDDTQEPRYAELVKAAAGPTTMFLPHLPQEELASAYAAAQVHALVSWYEMMPLAALEAGAAGCNVVLTTETAGREFFGDKVWYCESDDSADIRRALYAALATPRRTGLAEHIREHFTWDKTAASLKRAYDEAIQLHRDSATTPANEYTRQLEELVVLLDTFARDNETLAERTWEHSLELNAELERIARLPGVGGLRRLKRYLPR